MIRIPALAVLGFALLASPALAGERAAADVVCEPTAKALVYLHRHGAENGGAGHQ